MCVSYFRNKHCPWRHSGAVNFDMALEFVYNREYYKPCRFFGLLDRLVFGLGDSFSLLRGFLCVFWFLGRLDRFAGWLSFLRASSLSGAGWLLVLPYISICALLAAWMWGTLHDICLCHLCRVLHHTCDTQSLPARVGHRITTQLNTDVTHNRFY